MDFLQSIFQLFDKFKAMKFSDRVHTDIMKKLFQCQIEIKSTVIPRFWRFLGPSKIDIAKIEIAKIEVICM